MRLLPALSQALIIEDDKPVRFLAGSDLHEACSNLRPVVECMRGCAALDGGRGSQVAHEQIRETLSHSIPSDAAARALQKLAAGIIGNRFTRSLSLVIPRS